jgi:fatty acid desaturase
MRNFVRDVFSTTGITIAILVVIGTLLGGVQLFFSTVYQSLIVNIVLHTGMIFMNKIEIKYSLAESALKIGFIFLIIIPAGILFNWYATMPLWAVMVTGLLVYFFSCFVYIIRMNNDIKFINKRLAERKDLHETKI